MRGNKGFDLKGNPDVSYDEEEASRGRAGNEDNVVFGVDERGRNGAVSSSDEKFDEGSNSDMPPGFDWRAKDDESRVSSGECSGGSGSRVDDYRVSGGEHKVRVFGRDDGMDGSGRNRVPAELMDFRVANVELVAGVSDSNGNVVDVNAGKRKPASGGSDLKIAVPDGSIAGGVKGGKRAGSMTVGYGLEMGDMVWGKVKSHPWWPGHIFNEAFASASVRRLKREGHVLVAFFGDSSYGWFDPAELIPYEPHFLEKSQQTNSRNFVKAVEESVDEASRRSALGLSCRCRNPYNFRPSNVQGYQVVDVGDYEATYSVDQIKRARDAFESGTALAFLKQVALSPREVDTSDVEFVKKKAMALSYRRAKFEEFDETYAQAFGQEPVRPVRSKPGTDQPLPARAPLSGPLVIAEALGGRKSSTKAAKSKEQGKRDRYLLKRRDEPKGVTAPETQIQERLSDPAADNYVFQRRDLAVPVEDGQAPTSGGHDGLVSTPEIDCTAAAGGPSRLDGSDTSGRGPPTPATVVREDHDGSQLVAVPDGAGAGKKVKTVKRNAGKLGSEQPDIGERKKKRKKETEMSSDNGQKQLAGSNDAPGGALPVNPVQIDVASQLDSQLSQKKEVEDRTPKLEVDDPTPSSGAESNGVELPQLLEDLQALALNPFHGAEKNRPAFLKQFFLRYRSLVFVKSAAASPSLVTETPEVRTIRSPPLPETQPIVASSENTRSIPPSKPPKPLGIRADDPTKAGGKRVPSERLEESAAKRAKKIADAKSSAAEKRTLQKIPEAQRAEGRGKAPAPAPAPAPATARKVKMEPRRRVQEPTYLMVKFPHGSALPSANELRAKFVRFGPMEASGNRIFYSTNTCRVMFLYREDAQRAYGFCVGNRSVFPNVRCFLKPVSVQDPSSITEENEPPRAQPPATDEQRPLRLPTHSSVQLKSILKKPAGEEVGSGVKGVRVRFNMGEDSSAAGAQAMDHGNSAPTFQDSGPSFGAVDTAAATSTRQPVPLHSVPPSPPPPDHILPQTPVSVYSQQHSEVGLRSNLTNPMPSKPPNADISQQMLHLLSRCHDIVARLTSAYGYSPYHRL